MPVFIYLFLYHILFLSFRLAVNNVHYISSVLGIKDPIHRQKIAVKAMDVVLFGSPKDSSNVVKDVTLITLLIVALVGGWYTYRSNVHSKRHLNKLMEHMEILSSAEKELQELQVNEIVICIVDSDVCSSYIRPIRHVLTA